MAEVTAEARTWLGGSGETVKRLDRRNRSNKTASVATAEVQTGLGSDGGNNMTEKATAQSWLVIRRQQQ